MDLPVRNWGIFTADGVAWLRGLLDLIIEKNKLESITSAPDYDAWAAVCVDMPQTISITEDEVLALRAAIRWVPRFDEPADDDGRLAQGSQRPKPSAVPEVTLKVSPVVLFSPGNSPVVLGHSKARLSLPQFRIVKALLDAGDSGLSKGQLQAISGDALNVLKRLAKSDKDWGAVIHLAGKPGRKYRIDAPATFGDRTLTHTDSSPPSHTNPHSSK